MKKNTLEFTSEEMSILVEELGYAIDDELELVEQGEVSSKRRLDILEDLYKRFGGR